MNEQMKQQIREAADFVIRLLTVLEEPAPDQPGQQDEYQQTDYEADHDGPDAQQGRRP